jgi:CRISPR-associated protein Csb1
MSDENQSVSLNQFDDWLKDDSDVAALVIHQWLEPVEGKDAIIFPPTYAKPEGMNDEDWSGYIIDDFNDGSSVCLIDSVGSQANRMEPIFKRKPYSSLVPQVLIKAGEREVSLLDAGHRAADAIVRFANKMLGESDKGAKSLSEQLWNAFKEWQEYGNAEPLARIAPTSLIFGAWDSRATQAKLPRIVRSVIRAYDVKRCTRKAQFNTPLHYVDEGLIDESLDKGEGGKNPLSQEGFRHNPAPRAPGGVVAREIRRDASLNLAALRTLGVKPERDARATEERCLKLRRYILGLAVVALGNRDGQQLNLREGCLLRVEKSSTWQFVPFEGEKRDVAIDEKVARKFAEQSAIQFGVQQFENPFLFDNKKAEAWLKLKKDDRDKRRREGPVIKQDLSRMPRRLRPCSGL